MKKYNMILSYLKLNEIRDIFLIPSYLDSRISGYLMM